jgi:hypothetical protein
LLRLNVTSVMRFDGASVMRFDSASVVRFDSASVVRFDSASVVGLDGASVVGLDGTGFGNRVDFTLPTSSESSTVLQLRNGGGFALLVVPVRTANSSFVNGIDFTPDRRTTTRDNNTRLSLLIGTTQRNKSRSAGLENRVDFTLQGRASGGVLDRCSLLFNTDQRTSEEAPSSLVTIGCVKSLSFDHDEIVHLNFSLGVGASCGKSNVSVLQDVNELQAASVESVVIIARERTLNVWATAGFGALSTTRGAAATATAMVATARATWGSIAATIHLKTFVIVLRFKYGR